jgi:hypothetical protein
MKELMKLGTVLMNYLSEARTWDFPVTWCCIPFIFH